MLKRIAIIALVILAICVAISYPFCRGRFYASKIITAVKQNNVAAVKSLLNKGINVNAKDREGQSLLNISIKNKYKEITRLLLEKGADLNIKDDITIGGLSAFHWAVIKDDVNLVEILLAKGANIDSPDDRGETPLHHAVFDGKLDIIKILLSKGANVNVKNNERGLTPLHTAAAFCKGCKTEIINLLLEYGADIDAVTNKGGTAIQYAFASNRKEAVNLLISEGANVNIQNISGLTLLHHASYKGNSEMVKILLSNGAKPNIKDNDGKTPLDIAIKEGHSEIVTLLKENGAKTGAEIDESGQ